MTVFTVIVLYKTTLLLIVVKCLQLSTNNIGSATEIGADVKNSTLLQDCGERDIIN